jgi:hypothetical protein
MQRNATVQPLLYRHGGVRAEVVGPSLVAGVVFLAWLDAKRGRWEGARWEIIGSVALTGLLV